MKFDELSKIAKIAFRKCVDHFGAPHVLNIVFRHPIALIYVSFIHNIIPSVMQLFLSLIPFTTCFDLKRPSSDVKGMSDRNSCVIDGIISCFK
jgi:hypothetical protein